MEKNNTILGDDHFLFANNVLDMKEVTTGKFILSFKKQFGCKPGQVVALSVNHTIPPRIYSLCNGSGDPSLQVLFDLNNQGVMTPLLSQLKKGDRLYVSRPYGSYLPSEEHPMWWIATGTGVAPFYSMLRSGYTAEKLIHGARENTHFYFANEFTSRLNSKYLRCNSGNDGAGEFHGRVTDYLKTVESLPKQIKYYLCGQTSMIVEVRDLLISKGVPFENIIAEIFF
jgi:ferredoxin/flavodoxin---NADP+ reductase